MSDRTSWRRVNGGKRIGKTWDHARIGNKASRSDGRKEMWLRVRHSDRVLLKAENLDGEGRD